MRAILKEQNITNKRVWVADSFVGVPKPDEKNYIHDKGNKLYKERILRVSLEEVKNNFRKYDLLDEQVVFLKGLFRDTLTSAPIEKLALLRLDGDLYSSTIESMNALYPKLSPGGYAIVDDYNAFPFCRQAIDDYRAQHNISEEIIKIDKEAVYWRKQL